MQLGQRKSRANSTHRQQRWENAWKKDNAWKMHGKNAWKKDSYSTIKFCMATLLGYAAILKSEVFEAQRLCFEANSGT
jgi:hypothetical protein